MKKHNIVWINIIFWVVFTLIIFIDYEPIWLRSDAKMLAFLNLMIDCPLAFLFLYLFEIMYEKKYIKKLLGINDDNNFTYQFTFLLSIAVIAVVLAAIDGCLFLWLVTGHWKSFTNESKPIINGFFSENGGVKDVSTFLAQKLRIIGFNLPIYEGLSKFQVEKIHQYYRNVPEALFSFGLFTGVRMAFKYFDSTRSLEFENERKDTQKSILESDLAHQKELSLSNEKNLRWQIKPHVLINAIETIDSYIELKEPKSASDMLKRVAKIQQYLLDHSTENVVLIEEELNFIEDYLSRYKVVNVDNFNYEFVKNNITSKHQIAPLLLIDLVENAIKYNNNKTPIRVYASVENDYFTFEVQNTSNDTKRIQDKGKRTGGIGLINMERRLNILYEDRFIFNKWKKDDKTEIISTSLKIKLS
jgi:Histidine kinase